MMLKNKLVLASSCPHEITVINVCIVMCFYMLCLFENYFPLSNIELQLLCFSQYYVVLSLYPDNYPDPYLKD